MQQPSAPATVRNFQTKPLNHHSQDSYTKDGVRISTPVYIDLTQVQRKSLLNAVRSKCNEPAPVRTPVTASGISVQSSASQQAEIESFLGVSVDVLRQVLFTRGGIDIALLLRLQAVSGLEVVSVKEIAAALKSKTELIKGYAADHVYPPVVEE